MWYENQLPPNQMFQKVFRKMYHQTKDEHARMNKHIAKINNEVETMHYSKEEVLKELEYSHKVMHQFPIDKDIEKQLNTTTIKPW